MTDVRQAARESLDAFNSHDAERIRDGYADRIIFEAPGDVRLTSPDEATEFAMSWLRAFPDAKITAQNELAAGDWFVYEFTFEGTHENPLVSPDGEIPATNKQLKGRGAQIMKFENGKIVEEHLYWDQVQLLTQLGLMPEASAATA
jgi:steroid delta-isomerase-like uncharacterized protein